MNLLNCPTGIPAGYLKYIYPCLAKLEICSGKPSADIPGLVSLWHCMPHKIIKLLHALSRSSLSLSSVGKLIFWICFVIKCFLFQFWLKIQIFVKFCRNCYNAQPVLSRDKGCCQAANPFIDLLPTAKTFSSEGWTIFVLLHQWSREQATSIANIHGKKHIIFFLSPKIKDLFC